MVWTEGHTARSRRAAKSRQAKADRKALPVVLQLRARSSSYRHIADELNRQHIPPLAETAGKP